MSDRLAVLPQYLLPKQALTMLAGKIAGAQAGHLTTRLIRWFVTRYNVNMDEAANSDIASYQSFNEFFTRPLRDGARPLAKADFITLHTPLTDQTRNILSAENLAKAKPGVRIINCARGGLVNEDALYEALVSNHV